jgi:hypothetical protein
LMSVVPTLSQRTRKDGAPGFLAVPIRLLVGNNQVPRVLPLLASMEKRATTGNRCERDEDQPLEPWVNEEEIPCCVIPFHQARQSTFMAGGPPHIPVNVHRGADVGVDRMRFRTQE